MRLGPLFKEMRWIDAWLYLASRVLETASGGRTRIIKYYIVAQPIGVTKVKPLRPDAATAMQTVGASDPLAAEFPRPPDVLAWRYATGASCVAATVRGEFAGFIWLARDRYDEDEVRCTYVLSAPAVSRWDFDVFVVPRFRAGRTMARLWAHVDADLAAAGVHWTFSRISAFNPASLASHARLGTRRCSSILFVPMGRWQLAFHPNFPYCHVAAPRRPAPVVVVAPPS